MPTDLDGNPRIVDIPGIGGSGTGIDGFAIDMGAYEYQNNNCSLPAAPLDVSVLSGTGQATISWSTVSGATSYNIYYSTTSGNYDHQISVGASPYIHTGLTHGVTYYYVITAINACGDESSFSDEVSTVVP